MLRSFVVRRMFRSCRRKRCIYYLFTGLIVAYFLCYGKRKTTSTSKSGMFNNNQDPLTVEQTCVHPRLNPNDNSVSRYFHKIENLTCSLDQDWTVTSNGKFWITEQAKQKHGEIRCQYASITRSDGNDDITQSGDIKRLPSDKKERVPSDFFKVSCISEKRTRYHNVHATISDNYPEQFEQKQNIELSDEHLNVLMFGFDSVSRMTWMRNLPKTRWYTMNVLSGIELEGYNIVGDGTPQALLPILTGKTETGLPEVRRGYTNSTTMDHHPWIWKDFQKEGYVTQWGEDMASIGTFNLRMNGFIHAPVKHYLRPFYLVAEKLHKHFKPFCLGSTPRHRIIMNWVRDSFIHYTHKPKFIFAFHSEYSHGDANKLQWADEDFTELLRFLHDNNHLNKTVLILMSDHGARFSDFRKTLQGKLEERMPYFSFSFPSWFRNTYPTAYRNFVINSKRLTTPFDIYQTLKNILYIKRKSTAILDTNTAKDKPVTRISLFEEVSKFRKCSDAGVAPHWCACLRWNDVNTTSEYIRNAALKIQSFINDNLLHKFNHLCENLKIMRIDKAIEICVDDKLLKYTGSSDSHGRVPKFDGHHGIIYQLTITTSPGSGLFEVTVTYISDNNIIINEREISRINKYGHDPDCVVDIAPHLRPYCYCTKKDS